METNMRQYAFRKKHPVTGKELPELGIIYISDDSQMSRVPEGAKEVGSNPVEEDKEGAYFEAWRMQSDGSITIDLVAARDIKMKWLRERRDAFFNHLDRVQFKYFCSKNEEGIAKVEEEKQELRDFPEKINWDAVNTLHDVKHILPPILI
jgi:hypothetical protein